MYTDGNTRHRGITAGIEHLYGEKRIRIQITTGDCSTFLASLSMSKNIELFEWEGVLPIRDYRRAASRSHGLVEVVLGQIDPIQFVAKSRLDALILGRFNLLRSEILETSLAVRQVSGRFVTGTFQDVLRAKPFSSTQAYRTDIWSDSGNQAEAPSVGARAIVIFDGARAFLKHREKYRPNSWIVLLDRTSPGFLDAAEALNQEYINAHREDFPIDTFRAGDIYGVELLSFRETQA